MNEEQKQLSEAVTETLSLRKEAEYLTIQISKLKEDEKEAKEKLDKTNKELQLIYKTIDKKSEEAMNQVMFEEQIIKDIQNKMNLELNARETAIEQSQNDINKMKADITIAYNNQKASEQSSKQSELSLERKIAEIDKIKRDYDKKNEELLIRERNIDVNNQAQEIVERNLVNKEQDLKSREDELDNREKGYIVREHDIKEKEKKVEGDIFKNSELLVKITEFNREYVKNKQDLELREIQITKKENEQREKAKQYQVLELDLKKRELALRNR